MFNINQMKIDYNFENINFSTYVQYTIHFSTNSIPLQTNFNTRRICDVTLSPLPLLYCKQSHVTRCDASFNNRRNSCLLVSDNFNCK